jgi:hypothetical protein
MVDDDPQQRLSDEVLPGPARGFDATRLRGLLGLG